MASSFGIDLGTTNSTISRIVQGKPVPILINGDPLVPSVVLFKDGQVTVGREARNLELMHPEATVRSVKRRMGQDYRYQLAGQTLSPEQISAHILTALKEGAEKATGEAVQDVVITVPAYFDDTQRRATLSAGELAGLNVTRLLNEPTSASLVYDQVGDQKVSTPEFVLIFDLGGGTFDVSVLEVFEGVREVRATNGNTHLGGDDFDEALVRLFVDELKRRSSADPTADIKAMVRLHRVAEQTKIRLSIETEVEVREEFITTDDKGRPVHLALQVTRRQFEEAIAPLLESALALCHKALDDAHLSTNDLTRICLVGGSTRVPLCRAMLAESFQSEIHEEIDPDLAVALGASIQAGLLSGEPLERILVDVASHTLGIRVIGPADYSEEIPDTFAPVLRRNTALPAQRTEEFYTIVDNQEKLNVEVFQGEAARVSQNASVGSFFFPLRPAPSQSSVRVQFAYDLNGVIKVSVAQVGTDNEKTVALSVSDASTDTQKPAKTDPIASKALKIISQLEDKERLRMKRLLDTYLTSSGNAKDNAEEALLDMFLELEDGDDQ
jgi:molecular chaperone DnaK